jgi:hypothetical protein
MRVLGVSLTTIDENLYEAVRAGSCGRCVRHSH